MTMIDPTARIEDGAVIGEGTTVGPYCMVGPNVVIGKDCKLIGHVSVAGHTTVAAGCVIYPFAGLGGPPQDLSYRGEPTRLEIGEECTIREGVTMNVGTKKGGGITRIRGFKDFLKYRHLRQECVMNANVFVSIRTTQVQQLLTCGCV